MEELLSKKFLQSIGVQLDEPTYDALSKHYGETLNARVIESIVDQLNEQQLIAFASVKSGPEADIAKWLGVNVPEIDEIIEDEIAILLGEMAEAADSL